jgi:asparagine synthase (glutamine-hydrolysing)
MCGIAGLLLAPSRADPARLAAIGPMTARLYHRGPDGEGFWHDAAAGVAFGHRRLAIVDLSEAGRQPMLSHDGRLVACYNGEIYNAPELRPELERKGHAFRGHSDTEIMLAAFESYGVEHALPRLAGMFATGLWDRAERVLHLVRDRLGKKPLYVSLVDGALLFASELKALRAFPGFQPRIDTGALVLLLRHGWIPDNRCIWQDVFKLPPGSLLSVRAEDLQDSSVDGLRARVRSWWSLAEVASAGQREPLELSDADAEDELDRLLRIAVGERMVADVPLGAFLSGGIDSSTVVAMMQARSSRPIRTFTIGFKEAHYDEAYNAALISRHLGTDHTEFRVTPADAYQVIPHIPEIWDEPFADESQIPTFLVAQLARQHVTVALSGDGGDECFGGYARHFVPARLQRLFGVPLGLRRAAAFALQVLSHDTMQGVIAALPLPAHVSWQLNSSNMRKLAIVLDAGEEAELYRRLTSVSENPISLASPPESLAAAPALPDLVGRLMYRDMANYLPGDILVKADRASMAVSLEARCPMLDHRVVEFAWRLPSSFKVRAGKGKWLLRRVLSRYVPEALYERPKQGFNVPTGAWLKGPLRDWAEALLARPRIQSEGLLDSEVVGACWNDHLAGRCDRSGELWAILMFEAWLDATQNPAGQATTTRNADGRLVSWGVPIPGSAGVSAESASSRHRSSSSLGALV